jgi:phospholipid/cholesterol/gamma-HCH transport system substrate-binding protein
METRSNHVLVGTVVLGIVVVGLLFVVWLAQIGGGHQNKYDIFFPNSVEGLAKGSAVAFSGVPVGKIDEIRLLPDNPSNVRVRISVDDSTPILQGTTASIAGVGFTGVSQVNLRGAIKGAPPIAELGPFGVPVIPVKPGGLGALLASAPQLLDKLTTLTDRLGTLLDNRNQNSIRHILANIDTVSSALATRGGDIQQTMRNANRAIAQAGDAAEKIGRLADSGNRLLDEQERPLAAQLQQTVAAARHSAEQIDDMVTKAKPGVLQLTTQTAPEVDRLVRDLSEMADALTQTASRLNSAGAGGVLGGGKLPDYKGK